MCFKGILAVPCLAPYNALFMSVVRALHAVRALGAHHAALRVVHVHPDPLGLDV